MRFFLSVLLFANFAFSAEKPKDLVSLEKPSSPVEEPNYQWRTNFGILAFASWKYVDLSFGGGYSFGVTHRFSERSDFSYGLDASYLTGVDLGGILGAVLLLPLFGVDTEITSYRMLPLLPTVMIRSSGGSVHPYAGFSAGPAFTKVEARNLRTGETKSESIVYFMAGFRGGVDIDIYERFALAIEPLRLGVVRDSFYYAAQFDLAVRF